MPNGGKRKIHVISLNFYKTRGPWASTVTRSIGLYTDLSEELIFEYKQPHHRINKNQQWQRKAAL